MKHRRTDGHGQRGVVIIWLALFMLLILAFISVGIDLAKLMATRTQLQNAADAAALAGASALDVNTGTIVQATAVARAQQTGAQNKAFINDVQPVAVNSADVTFPSPTQCRVVVRREGGSSIVAHFAQVLGIASLQMKADATAEVDTVRDVSCGIVPLAAVPLPGSDFEVGCAQNYQLKLGAGGGVNGNYYGLNFPPCNDGPCAGMSPTGAATYRCLLLNGYCCELTQGQVLSTQPGNISGPTGKAIDDRFKSDSVRTENICYDQYLALGGTGQRVVTVPITSAPAGGGNTNVTIERFGVFFLKNKPGPGNDCILSGEFIYAIVPGTGSGSGSGAVAFAVRLVE